MTRCSMGPGPVRQAHGLRTEEGAAPQPLRWYPLNLLCRYRFFRMDS
jgi:hypothetical protein